MSSGARPLVSVITIFLDAERFLEEAIQSVLAQTYPSWELVLVDDGSRDRSGEIAAHHARVHPERIRVVQHPGHENRGMSASRNLGIAAARGEYLAFLDADDVYLPEKLERQVESLARRPGVGMIYGATLYWYSWTGRPEDRSRDRVRRRRLPTDTVFQPPELFKRFVSGQARTPCTCGVLLRRSAVEAVGGFEEQFRGINEDQAFFCKVALGTPIYVEPGCWDRYRQHQGSAVHRSQRTGEWQPGHRPAPARREFVGWLCSYLERQGVRDPDLWREVRRQARPLHHPRLYQLRAGAEEVLEEVAARARSAYARLSRLTRRP